MTLGITFIAESTGGNTLATNKVTGSFTPPANAKLYVAEWEEGTGAVTAPTSASLSFTAVSGPTAGGGTTSDGLWVADTGPSPPAMTITVNASGSTSLAYVIFAITGSTPQIKSGQLVRSPNVVTASVPISPLPAAATPGNLVVIIKLANQDTNTPMTLPAATGVSGFTNLYTPVNHGDGDFEKTGVEWSTTQSTTLSGAAYSHDVTDQATAYLIEFKETSLALAKDILMNEQSGLGAILTESGFAIQIE